MAKDEYMNVTLSRFIKESPSKFWRYLNSKPRQTSNPSPAEAIAKATEFNDYFVSVFTRDNGRKPDLSSLPGNRAKLDDLILTESGIFCLLLEIDPKKSCGPDSIPNAFLKRYAEWMSKFLLIIYVKSLKTGEIPDKWKTAKVIPIHKSGDLTNTSNYRPISLTCTAGKILEHLILKHIVSFVEKNNLIVPKQHGFRKGLSTTTQLIETIHDLALTMDKCGQTDIIFLDLSKAFDRVSHPKLLQKLTHYLGDNSITKWIKSYLGGRRQYVCYKDHSSDYGDVLSGVPQGAVLAPMLFLLFINDLHINCNATVRMFADDCIIYKEITCREDQIILNRALEHITQWCQTWQMVTNAEKNGLHDSNE